MKVSKDCDVITYDANWNGIARKTNQQTASIHIKFFIGLYFE